MISCIICSQNDVLLDQVSSNIQATIGVPFEIIAINNEYKKKGICEVYNEGASLALFPFLCFVHEDVLFETFEWGKNAIAHFDHAPDLGLIGIAGSQVKSNIISTWYRTGAHELSANRYNYVKCSKKDLSEEIRMNLNPLCEDLSEVVCLDGVFLFTKKTILETNKFDQKLLQHFHCYDLDFSFVIHQTHKVGVVYDILLRHYSDGFASHLWIREAFKLHKKWQYALPLSVDCCVDPLEKNSNDLHSFNYFMLVLRKAKNTFLLQLKMIVFFVPRIYSSASVLKRIHLVFKEIRLALYNFIKEKSEVF